MSQHFLLSAQARSLSLKEIYQGGEDAAYANFCKLRWMGTDGEPVCPRCGGLEAYDISTRRKFKCRECYHQFSVTSGTILASRKLSFTDIMAAICILTNSAKGISALQLSRDLNVQHKTAWVLAHKLREAMADETEHLRAGGEIEVDGAYFGGYVKPRNLKKDRIDRRRARYRTGKLRVVVAIRDRDGRTLTSVHRKESEGVAFVNARALPSATVIADEANHWDWLEGRFKMQRINHSEGYSIDGVHTNNAESYFSRLRRMVLGQHHHVSPKYLHAYAAHAAWLEDHRRDANGTLAFRALRNALLAPVSREWKGYWQRRAA